MTNKSLPKTIQVLIKYGEFDSLLKWDGKYYICFKQLGREQEITKEEFLMLQQYLPAVDADA